MSDTTLHDQIRALEDRAAIIDLVCRFAVSIDRRRWADFEACFADEIDLNTIRTGTWVRRTRQELVAMLREAFESYTATQHISANHQVTIDGDNAAVVSTLNATHYLAGAPDGEFQQQVGYYEYRVVRDGAWRIASIQQFPHWQRGNQSIFDRTVR